MPHTGYKETSKKEAVDGVAALCIRSQELGNYTLLPVKINVIHLHSTFTTFSLPSETFIQGSRH